MPTHEAMNLAAEAGLQLVEVNPKANPPVCKIMDYGKYKYETAKKEKESKKHQKTLELKEVKFRPKTHGHDFDFKVATWGALLDEIEGSGLQPREIDLRFGRHVVMR